MQTIIAIGPERSLTRLGENNPLNLRQPVRRLPLQLD